MKKRIYFLAAMLLPLLSPTAFAYNNGDQITIDGIIYQVSNATNHQVYAYGTSGLTGSVVIPSTVFDGTDITFDVVGISGKDNGTGSWGNGITQITLPNSIKTISPDAFSGSSITTLNIPASVTNIATPAFVRLRRLNQITVDAGNVNYKAADGSLYSKDGSTLVYYPVAKYPQNGVLTVPEGVTELSNGAIFSNSRITEINLPSSLTTFYTQHWPTSIGRNLNLKAINVTGEGAFTSVDGVLFDKDMATLYSFPCAWPGTQPYKVPDGVGTIKKYAICANSKLRSIDLNQTVQMEESAIDDCPNLTTVKISANMTNLTGGITGCDAIENYYVDEANDNFCAIDGIVYSKDSTFLYLFPPARTSYTFPADTKVKEFGYRSFMGSKLTSLTVPPIVEQIDKEAMRNMKNLTTISFEEPSSLKQIQELAFWGCTNLTTINLPATLEALAAQTFYECPSLKTVTVADGSQLTSIGARAFRECYGLEHFEFLGSCALQRLEQYAFANLTNLKEFNFPSSVTYIGESVFSNCSSMETATFAEDAVLTSIGRNAFADSGIKEITLPNSVTRIEAEAFKNCDVLETITLSDNVTYVSPEAFKYCSKLMEIEIDDANEFYSSVDGMLLTKDKETLVLFPPGKANESFIVLPPSLTTIGDYAFYACTNLYHVTIPNKVTKIGQRSFGFCSNLKTIAFLNEEMVDPAGINQTINGMSFDNGTNGPPSMFPNIDVNVRKELIDAYRNDPFYSQFKSINPSFVIENRTDKTTSEEFIAVSDRHVDILNVETEDYTYVLPSQVTHPVTGANYQVSIVNDYLLQNTSDAVKEVVVFNNIQYIGARAFMTTTNLTENQSTVENIFFIDGAPTKRMLSTTRFKLRPSDLGASADKLYSEIASTTNIFVKKSAYETYKGIWTDYQEKIDYKVPGISIGTKYGTFSREFDVDLSDCTSSTVYAFTAGEYKLGTGDYGDRTKYMVRMTSINHTGDNPFNSSGDDDGTYIPANSGVLLKVMDENRDATPSDYYYCIGENSKWDNAAYSGETVMNAVTVNSQRVESDGSMYVMSGGQWKKVNAGKTVTMPVHKAYMKLEGVPSGAKVMLVFGNDEVVDIDNGNATGINAVNVNQRSASGTVYYNMQGQRVNQPNKGVFVKDGRKVIKK